MPSRYKDFDSFFEEIDGPKKPFTITLFGQEWTLPDDAGAGQILRLQRVRASSLQLAIKSKADLAATLTDEEVAEFRSSLEGFDIEKEARELLGDGNVTAWLKRGLPYPKLTSIFWWAVSVYEGSTSADRSGGAEGEPRAPKGAAQMKAQAKTARAKSARNKKRSSARSSSSKAGTPSSGTSTASTG